MPLSTLGAVAAAGIGEGLACFGNELPFVGAGLERELQNAKGGGIAHFAVGLGLAEGTMVLAARANDKFADAAFRVGNAIRSLRSKALVIVVVTADNHIGVGI